MRRRASRIGLFLAVLTAGLIYLSLQYSPQQLLGAGEQTSGPRYPETFSEGVTSHQFDRQGRLSQTLESERITYYSQASGLRSRIEQPELTFYNGNETAPWHLSAQSALGTPQDDTLTLQTDVLARTHHPQQGPLRISTEQLTLETSSRRAHTDKPVTIRSARGTTHAVGLEADMNIGRITLLSEVKGIYEPR